MMKKWIGFFTAALFLIAAISILPIHGEAQIYDSVIRLHVLANSDSDEDQARKLAVRDAVLESTRPLLEGAESREEAEVILQKALPEIKEAAELALERLGSGESVSVSLSWENYPTREYESLAFPAGEYLSLRVMIGEAEGKNWWCVLFPPLCLSAASVAVDQETACLSAGLTDEQYRLIADADSSTKYRLRFKILEVASGLFD